MVKVIKVRGQLSGKEYLEARIYMVTTIETGQKAESVEQNRTYLMWVRLRNTYKNDRQNTPANYDDKWWYYDISLRILPKTDGIQIYSGAGFQTPVPRATFLTDVLGEQRYRWYPVYFKWTKSAPKDVNDLEFSFGLYAQEVQRVTNWATLKP